MYSINESTSRKTFGKQIKPLGVFKTKTYSNHPWQCTDKHAILSLTNQEFFSYAIHNISKLFYPWF